MGFHSLALRLATNVLLALTICFVLLVALVLIRAERVSTTIHQDSLEAHVEAIVQAIRPNAAGELELVLPAPLERLYAFEAKEHIYVVKAVEAEFMWVSHPELRPIAARWGRDQIDELVVRIEDVFSVSSVYHGVAREFDTPHGRFIALTAQAGGQAEFAGLLLSSFVKSLCDLRDDDSCAEFADFVRAQLVYELRWIIPLFILLLVGTVIVTIRLSLRPLSAASKRAAAIDPTATSVRLDGDRVPAEVAPLVAAINGAFDRLEDGYAAERRFTANAAHELRTPLSILRARLDRLAHEPDADEIRSLSTDVDRMARVVGQLLAIARLEMPATNQRQPVVLNDLVREATAQLAPLAIERGQRLGARLPAAAVEREVDAGQLHEALENLIENAIRHCPPGTSIEVELRDDASMRVIDHGPGVAPQARGRLFERFFRAGHGTPGAGLGLAIARDIAQQHGGTVRFEETPGGGATFVLTIQDDPPIQGRPGAESHKTALN